MQEEQDAERDGPDFQLSGNQKENQVEQDGKKDDPGSQLLDYFSEVVSPFNTRKLTRSSDLPMAFQGIANFLVQNAPVESLFAIGLCWGLPIAGMPDVLTWTTAGEDLRPRSSPPIFPSWSWFAWEGAVQGEKKGISPQFQDTLRERGRPVPACKWDIVDIHTLSTPPSPDWSPNAESGRYIRIAAEQCVLEGWNHSLIGQVHGERFIWKEGFPLRNQGDRMTTWIFPDQPAEFTSRKVGNVELLAISEYTARLGTSRRYTFVKALWIERDKPRLGSRGQHVTVHRRGVAMVERELWDRHAVKNARHQILMLG